ncbi:hypothetical protein LOS88_10595 [Aeromonas veronii]|uniref:hypothetical protein n=1 Tax=Aeromonas veronii TaxID=654 RepID=UPI001FD55070|nr:hypothetical protein [Aeromonas veronii]MCJ7977640.1 hypothetical protein [Aeromonas veronii]UOR21449.1 hypothetical protein LOS88_10595 [Aeromonas veronii]
MAVLDSIQSPIMGYRPKGSEKVAVVAGIFTYHRLLQQQATSKPIAAVQIFLLDKAPKPDLRELLLLHELSRSLLRECFTHSTATIADYLHAWFDCRAESSLFGSDKWQQLFPQLRTKADLCGWLQLGDAVEELINQLVGLLQSGGHSRGMHGVFAHGGSVSKEQDQASRKVGSRDDRLIFPVSILFR